MKFFLMEIASPGCGEFAAFQTGSRFYRARRANILLSLARQKRPKSIDEEREAFGLILGSIKIFSSNRCLLLNKGVLLLTALLISKTTVLSQCHFVACIV